MRKLLILFILFSNSALAQKNALDSAIQKNIKQMFVGADTTATVYTYSKSGSFNFDTIRIANNTFKHYTLTLTGYAVNNKVSCVKDIWVSNTNGVYSIDRNLSTVSFLGLTGGAFNIVKENGFIVVKVTGNTTIINWTLKKQ